jgi:YaiO family outer membrane protein
MKILLSKVLPLLCLADFSAASLHAGTMLAQERKPFSEAEADNSFKHWTIVPMYSYSFFNKGRQAWQEEDVQLFYSINRQLTIGGEIDIMERPPSGTNIYYSGLASYYPWKWLEVHGRISICPNPTFAAKQIYGGGFQYQMMPRIGLLFDYLQSNYIQGPIEQLTPGIALNFTDTTYLTLRYTRGWAYNTLEYNYYSAVLNIGMPYKGRLSLAFSYGTDPDAEAGANSVVTLLSPAYTYAIFYMQPVWKDLKLIAGIQYVYRLNQSGGQLYQQLTPTAGLSWRF